MFRGNCEPNALRSCIEGTRSFNGSARVLVPCIGGVGGLGVVVRAGLVSPPSLVSIGASPSELGVSSDDVSNAFVRSDASLERGDNIEPNFEDESAELCFTSFEKHIGSGGSSGSAIPSSSSLVILGLGIRRVVAEESSLAACIH